jgi:hypothetical protein
MTTNSELDETFELTEEQEFQLWKESVKADLDWLQERGYIETHIFDELEN